MNQNNFPSRSSIVDQNSDVPGAKTLPQDTKIQSVHSLELFFDLVFVFTISQITQLIAHPHEAIDYVQAGMVFWSMVWVYGSFVWLSSNIHFDDHEGERWNVILGMLCFFGMAVGVKHLANGQGLLFALSLLAAITVIICGFLRLPNSSHYAVAKLAPYNFATGLLILLAVILPIRYRWPLWGMGILLYFVPILFRKPEAYPFSFSPKHFVERHGLVTIIALGESVIALGVGASNQLFSLEVLAYCVAGLLLLTDFWWIYFGQTQPSIEHTIVQASPRERIGLATTLTTSHMALLAGCILLAASLEAGVLHPLANHDLTATGNLTAGTALFVLSLLGLRKYMGLPTPAYLWSGLGCTVLSLPIGIWVNSLWQLIMLSLMLLGVCFMYVPRKEHNF